MAAPAVAANVDVYLERVDQLYSDIRNWMSLLDPDAQISESEMQLDEEATGPYKAKVLEIARRGQLLLRFVPNGRYNVGADGRVDVRGLLGWEILLWVRKGGPAIGFRFSKAGEAPEELLGREMFPGIEEGWAWSDEDRGELKHLDLNVFRDDILNNVGTDA